VQGTKTQSWPDGKQNRNSLSHRQADELQRRRLELMNQAEAFFVRAESLVTRLEKKTAVYLTLTRP
jgi:hypothetical protein